MALMRSTADRSGRVAASRIVTRRPGRPYAALVSALASSTAIAVAMLVLAPVVFAVFSAVALLFMLTLAERSGRDSSRRVSEMKGARLAARPVRYATENHLEAQ